MNRYAFAEKSSSDASSERRVSGIKKTALRAVYTTLLIIDFISFIPMVPGAGLEPAQRERRGILNPLCLPIPPSGLGIEIGGAFRSRTGLDGFAIRYITALLTRLNALTPAAADVLNWSGKRDSNSRPRPWQGRALPTELFPHHQANLLIT